LAGNPNLGEINKHECAILVYQNPQEGFLNCQYADKDKVKKIDLNIDFEQSSELTIDNYPNLKEIKGRQNISDEPTKLTKLTISNFPKLEEVEVIFLRSLQELILHDLPNLKELNCAYNKLTTLDLSEFSNLKTIICYDNKLTQIKLPKGEKLESLNL
jgi:Leucine-rich repeat (LRR) protein